MSGALKKPYPVSVSPNIDTYNVMYIDNKYSVYVQESLIFNVVTSYSFTYTHTYSRTV